MGFALSGFVLRAPRVAPANAIATDEPTNGVEQDFKSLPQPNYSIPAPEFTSLAEDQYRTSVLMGDTVETEFLIFAANTADLKDRAAFEVQNQATGFFGTGTLTVTQFIPDPDPNNPFTTATTVELTDGTDRVFVVDSANRTINEVPTLTVVRGDTGVEVDLSTGIEWNPVTGTATITGVNQLAALDGGLSLTRNDTVRTITTVLAAPTFWWTKNDQYETRFKWDGQKGRWAPLKGTPPRSLGRLLKDESYTLSPAPRVTVGDFLPGDSQDPDSYSMVRIGRRPDSASTPIAEPVAASGFGGIRVVDDDAVQTFDFSAEPELSAVVGATTGELLWNPAFVEEFAGQDLWYSYQGFIDQPQSDPTNIEPLGDLETADNTPLFLAPIPGPTDFPFVRIGNRQFLDAKLVDTDALLAAMIVEEGQVGVSLSTGRLKFSQTDISKADPDSSSFDSLYLGAQVFYDGLSLTQIPVQTKAPVQLVNGQGLPTTVGSSNNLFIPDAQPAPSPGISGVQFVLDNTGFVPNNSSAPGIRPNESGLVRDIRGPWDLILFGESGQIRTIQIVDDDDEIPRFDFQLERNRAIVDLREGNGGSRVILSREDRQRFNGEPMFFLQTSVQPAVYYDQARMFSRVRKVFTLDGTEVFAFRIGAFTYTWDASVDPGGVATSAGGEFTPAEIAQSLNAVITGPGEAVVLGDRVALQTANLVNGKRWGTIEIGFGPNGEKDLSGPSALGFLPGWLINIKPGGQGNNPLDPTESRWLPDNGTNLGVFRSPLNLGGRQEDISDINHIGRFDDEVLVSSISQSPLILLDRPPLEDIPGYDTGVFFRFQNGLLFRNLENYEEVVYDFGTRRLFWADTRTQFSILEQPSLDIQLDRQRVVEASFRLPDKGLQISEAGSLFVDQVLNEDFLVLDNGLSGRLALVDTIGSTVLLGGRGEFTAGSTTFIDNSADIDFVAAGVLKGYQLQVQSGEAEGTYIVQNDATQTNSLTVSPPFPVTDSTVPWEIFEAEDRDTFDSGVIADVQFVQFNHLPQDPFKIRVLSDLGEVPNSAQAQSQNRLVAVVSDALDSGREISLRFGQPNASPISSLQALTNTNLGQIANGGLFVPDVASDRFSSGDFSIRVGDKTYTFASGDLVRVPSVSTTLTGDLIEVQDSDGLLNFGADTLTQRQGSDAIYVEEFLDPLFLPQGQAEFSEVTGEINLSLTDITDFIGETVYFVEQMNTEGGQDVTLNPIQGSFLFTKPLREFQLVEAEYFLAENGTGDLLLTVPENDPNGDPVPTRVIEFLPLTVRLEEATPTNDTTRWAFNPTGRTVEEGLQVFIDSTLTNVGSAPTSDVDPETSTIIFQEGVDPSSLVRITYTVYETFGGEGSFTTSQQPVYRPPFRIEADRTAFLLETDRRDDVIPGQLLRVGEFPFYITNVTYNSSTNLTTVDFIPGTQQEAGSRDPSTDSVSVLSSEPLSKTYNPDANDGFFIDIAAPYDPINRGFQEIVFDGNLTNVAVAGHLLELGGLPFLIAGSESIDNGTRTRIEITAFFPRGFNSAQDAARISGRPVYAPFPDTFLGQGAVLESQPFELILFGETDAQGNELPGRTLRETIDYEIDLSTGDIQFLNPPQNALQPGQTLYLRRTAQRGLFPVLSDGVLLYPKFLARFTHVTIPSEDNNLLRGILRAQYTFSQPDSWYYRTVPLVTYLGEVADDVARDVSALLPSQGPVNAIIPPVENKNQGNVGLRSEGRNLADEDRAARVFLEFYNEAVIAFEQVSETISGDIIGDRDGKFRFFIGRNNDFTPPGYENAITGELNRRNIFAELWFGYNRNLIYLQRDPLVEPETASLNGDQIQGQYIDPDLLKDLRRQQKELIANDVDDIVLVDRTRKRLRLFPLRLESFGRYRIVGKPSRFSRIFPEQVMAFTLTDPGIGADLEADPIKPGVYAFRKRVRRFSISGDGITLPKRASTFGEAIADIGNPVFGQVMNISSINVRNRLPRARVFAYSEVGFPEFDAAITAAGGVSFSALPRPAVIATPLPLQDFPLGPDGLPDISMLAAQGGETFDLTTGDPDLFTPAFTEVGRPKVAFGRPDGRIIDVATGQIFTFQFPPGTDITVLQSVFVGEVLLGCICTFADQDGNTLLSPSDIQEVAEDAQSTSGPIQLFQGDTFFITPPDADVRMGGDPNQPPTAEELEASVKGLPGYRIQFDLRVNERGGEFEDGTFPSFKDPSILGLKEILGQNPPEPLTNLEANVRFNNTSVEPLAIPALTGGPFNDDGDYSLPYLVSPNTEKNRLGTAQQGFNNLFVDSPAPGAVYPDEIQGVDGEIISAFNFPSLPATLETSLNAEPAYVPGQGVGPVRPFDLFMVETNQGVPLGTQGILSVGAVEGGANGSVFETPRFVSPTQAGDRFRYTFLNAMTFVNQPASPTPAGMVVTRVGNDTTFDITSISTAFLVFNNGTPALLVGGLNTIFNPSGLPYPNNDNRVTINLFNPNTNTFLQSVVIDINNGAPTATGNSGAQPIASVPTASDNVITVDTAAPFLTIGGGAPPELPEDPLNPGSSIPLEFTIHIDTADTGNVAANSGSFNGFINEDRVSFHDSIDFRTVLARNEPPIDGFNVTGQLSVFFVTGAGTDDLTVNGPGEVNGGLPFTFPERNATFSGGGEFDPSSGQGVIKVPGFEGHANAPITATDVVFSAIPSSNQDESGVICEGTGFAEAAVIDPDFDNRIINTTITNGALDFVEPGDVVVVQSDASGQASTKAGSYLVKYTESPTGANPYREILATVTETVPYNTGVGWAQPVFPRLVSIDLSSAVAEVDTTTLSDGSSSFELTGRLYFILDTADLTQTISIAYTGINNTTNEFQLQQGSGLEADGVTPVADSVFDALEGDTVVAGFTRVEIRLDRIGDETPANRNAVGFQGDGTFTFAGGGSANGFRMIDLANVGGTETFTYEQFGLSGPNDIILNNIPAADQLLIESANPVAAGVFQSTEDAVVYPNVAGILDLSALSTAVWTNIHGAGAAGVEALVPSDTLTAELRLQAGLFLEPTFPRPVQNLTGAGPVVVDAQNTLGAGQVGFRSSAAFGSAVTPEEVSFEVRRIRRFHQVLDDIADILFPLRYVYQIRRGTVTSFGPGVVGAGGFWPFVITASGGTNLGPFDDEDVNIFPNDIFRLLDDDGTLIEEVEIGAVQSGTQLVLKAPGITKIPLTDVPGKPFEIYLRNAPVPQEQNGEQLLALITDQVILDRTVDYTAQTGGFVATEQDPVQPRSVRDTDPNLNFQALGVQEGDIVIIDPAGQVNGPGGVPGTGAERGTRPFGDRSVPNRTSASGGQQVPFQAGAPSELDDNRGFYRVSEVEETNVIVESGHSFSGSLGGPNVTFGSVIEYALLPTVSGSPAPFAVTNVEGQNDLRPTAFAGQDGSPPNSYLNNNFSIAPFGYKIIRPSTLFSEEAVDLALFIRERNLSFLEEFDVFFRGDKSGTYFVFQRDEHIADLGNPLIPDEGKGVISNELINGVRGEVDISPFANTSDALSILDRRFFINDTRLDTEFPPGQVGVPAYAALNSNANVPAAPDGDGRPVLPDRITDILDNNDQFRELRFSWLSFRTNREDGTLATLERFEDEFNKRRRKALRQLRLQQSLEDGS